MTDTRKALQEAIALVRQIPVDTLGQMEAKDAAVMALVDIQDALAAPEGEPVAWGMWISKNDMEELAAFYHEICDGDGYTAPKEVMHRLAELGCVRHTGFGRYAITSFGEWLFESYYEQKPSLPLQTAEDFNKQRRRDGQGDCAAEC